MMNFLRQFIFAGNSNEHKVKKDDFADFFLRTKTKEKKKFFKKIIHKTNIEQKVFLDNYENRRAKNLSK